MLQRVPFFLSRYKRLLRFYKLHPVQLLFSNLKDKVVFGTVIAVVPSILRGR